MPGPILHLGASVTCMHGGSAVPTAPYPRVLVSGQPAVLTASPYAIAGCGLSTTSAPPCVTGQWVMGATRVRGNGLAFAIVGGVAVCMAPGTGMQAVSFQTRAIAT